MEMIRRFQFRAMTLRRTITGLVALGALLAFSAHVWAQSSSLGLDALKSRLEEQEVQLRAQEQKVLATTAPCHDALIKLESLPVDKAQATAAHEGRFADLPPLVKAAVEGAEPLVAAHHGSLATYFTTYDQVQMTRMDVKVLEVVQDLERARTTFAQKLGEVPVRGLDKVLVQVRKATRDYWEARLVTEGKESYKRLYALRALERAHLKAGAQVKRLERKASGDPAPGIREILGKVGTKIRNVAANLRVRASFAPTFGRLAAYLVNPWSKPDPDRMSDLMKELGSTFTTKGKVQIETVGRDRVPTDKKLIFTPTHRSGMPDSMIAVQLLPGQVTPLMTFRYYPKVLKPMIKNLLEDEPGLIPVDLPDIDVVQRSVDTVKNGRTLLIFPEGHVASPIGEVRPLRNGIDRITEQLLDENVAVVPITLDDPVDLWGQQKYANGYANLDMKVKVVFDRALDPRVIYMFSGRHSDLLLQLVREAWHRNLMPGLAAAPASAPAKAPERIVGETEYREPLEVIEEP